MRHRHRGSTETGVCQRGRVVEEYYDGLERFIMEVRDVAYEPTGPEDILE